MITVKLLGGAKKSLSTDKLEILKDSSTVVEIIDFLQQSIPKDKPKLDAKNILVAINGIDSSTLQGLETKLKAGDVVSIIPVIHGGGKKMTRISIINSTVELMKMKGVKDPVAFLDDLRQRHQDLAIQAIDSHYVLNTGHAKKIISISLASKASGTLLSNKLETDILMRFACTKQIGEAIKKVGLQRGKDFIIIAIGKASSLQRLFSELSHLEPQPVSKNNSSFLIKKFSISKRQLQAVMSTTPLEDLLTEKAAVLFR